MGTAVLANGTVFVDDDVRSAAQESLQRAHDRAVTAVKLVLEDGAELTLAPELTRLMFHVLQGTSRGAINVSNFPPELTSTAAANLLGVSRPTLMKWVRDKVIDARPVGTHHRFDTAAVLELARARRDERARAFDDLRAWDEGMGVQD